MKLNLTILAFCFLGFGLNAQKNIESNGIKISTKQINCNIPAQGYESDLIQLTITNTTNQVKTIQYSFELYKMGFRLEMHRIKFRKVKCQILNEKSQKQDAISAEHIIKQLLLR